MNRPSCIHHGIGYYTLVFESPIVTPRKRREKGLMFMSQFNYVCPFFCPYILVTKVQHGIIYKAIILDLNYRKFEYNNVF